MLVHHQFLHFEFRLTISSKFMYELQIAIFSRREFIRYVIHVPCIFQGEMNDVKVRWLNEQ